MNVVLFNHVWSHLWTQASTSIAYKERNDWTLFYSIEGGAVKRCSLLFYNAALKRIYLRTHIVDLKLEGVVVQKQQYISNIYSLIVEHAEPPLRFWHTDDDGPLIINDDDNNKHGSLIQSAYDEVYPCAPSILIHDMRPDFNIPRIMRTPPSIPTELTTTVEGPVFNVSGYLVYRKKHKGSLSQQQQHQERQLAGVDRSEENEDNDERLEQHKHHFPQSWIPFITVNADTFNHTFHVSCIKPRHSNACLECATKEGEVYNPMVTNLIMNH